MRADRTLYWIDVFPEEKSTFEEVMFVTQEGTFTSAVAEIESYMLRITGLMMGLPVGLSWSNLVESL